MKKIILILFLIFLVFPSFSQDILKPRLVSGDKFLYLDETAQLYWCYGFLQSVGQVVGLLQLEYEDETYLDFWDGFEMPVELFLERLLLFLKSDKSARAMSLPYVGLIVLQHYCESLK